MSMTPTPRRSETGPQRRGRPRGIALISVLWIVALLTVAAGGLSQEARVDTQLARNLVEVAQARGAATGALELSVLRLLNQAADSASGAIMYAGDSPQVLRVGDTQVRVRVSDVAGKVDLNGAPPELLAGLLSAAGLAEDEAASLADAIVDWRDQDNLLHLNGAEDGEYRRAGRAYGAKDRLFTSIEEVQLVLGMTPELYAKIRPALTVYSRQTGINPLVASRLALEALPGASADEVEAYLALREENARQGLPPPAPPFGDRQYMSGARGRAYTIDIQARTPGGSIAHLSVTLRITPSGQGVPYTVLDWQLEPPGVASLFDGSGGDTGGAPEKDSL
ncbi:MAG: general secretion pathway protein GspK [Gammaproteobacteria bacterium]|nr:general secretion pathway protein GspK [Gammaproteobacteria bacterium]NIR90067.1 general secretion pathway protein GspK [Gammaproteobacteria bacterium]NIU03271.1 general secretion pathway protein GspK [Gammaproteobacteria bacterium]NIV50765.1 general secretion pathway protein GspK [Gammaproteobacteria bacterium]NIV75351.1 general secretion pathway protein GspK [Gammaproteobacteria bacterium]